MKITYLVSQFPKISETFILGQITGLIDLGHDVRIIALSNPEEESVHEDVIKYELMDRVRYVEYHSNELGLKYDEEIVNSLVNTDIIHAHFAAYPAAWALKISEKFGVPFIFTAHAYDIFIDPDVDALKEKFTKCEKVITISDYNRKYLLDIVGEEYEDKIKVIRCGVNLKNFKYRKREEKELLKILFIGRLVEKKGILYAVEAFGKVAKKHQNAELRIIGDGPLKEDVEELTEKLGLNSRVKLIGTKNKKAVVRELNSADIFFLPSVTAENGDREGIPVSLIEAQATGLPVVSTRYSGIPELVSDGESGFLVEERDTGQMAEKLSELIKNPDLRLEMGKKGTTIVKKYHNRTMEISELNELLEGSVNNRAYNYSDNTYDIDLINERVLKITKLLENVDNDLHDQKALTKEYGDRLKKREKEIKEKNSELTKRHNLIINKNEEIRGKNKEIREKNEDIQRKKKHIQELQSNLDYIRSRFAYKAYITIKSSLDKLKSIFRSVVPK